MKLISMTATFGKLEHETLTLKPGLNIIHAPNEWGKSTWCAFLVTMLYGIDTRAKSTKTTLADKERYAPWSGSPMSGSIRLLWKGRDITIQRHTAGRIPMGQFRAFESESGLEVPELTADNCGETLLGVERSVFTRSGFLRFSDLPVTQDEQLRRRLNSLVTTGDESGSADTLGQKLRELKNRCGYHRTGLLPKALEEKQALESKLQSSHGVSRQQERLLRRKKELEEHIRKLENHKAALHYSSARHDEGKVRAAVQAQGQAAEELRLLEEQSHSYPSRQKAEEKLQTLYHIKDTWESVQMEERMLPKLPQPPDPPAPFSGCDAGQALEQVEAHTQELASLATGPNILPPVLLFLGIALLAAAALFVPGLRWIPMLGLGAAALVSIVTGSLLWRRHAVKTTRYRSRRAALSRHYGSPNPADWLAAAEGYQAAWEDYKRRNDACRRLRGDLDERREEMLLTLAGMSQGRGLTESLRYWREVLDFWDTYADAFRSHQRSQNHLKDLRSMARSAQQPPEPDELTFTEEDTNAMLLSATEELKRLHQNLGQCQGQSDAVGDDEALARDLAAVNARIRELELTSRALELALDALGQAASELQRRFAPRISQHAQELFSRLTGGKYPRLSLAADLSVHTGGEKEDTLRASLWRSDGTVDQLYLALRLAVARELTPDAPLILDDALVRFDDDRLAVALEILKEEADTKQVLLFTCRKQEQELAKQ